MNSIVPSVLALGLAMLAALVLTLRRPSPEHCNAERRDAARALLIALLAQSIHFAEEAFAGFHARFPELFGAPAMPFAIFATFNLTWITFWAFAVPGLRRNLTSARFAAWFLAIAGTLNGIAHPLMALVSDGYFPGLISSVLTGITGLYLMSRLRSATVTA